MDFDDLIIDVSTYWPFLSMVTNNNIVKNNVYAIIIEQNLPPSKYLTISMGGSNIFGIRVVKSWFSFANNAGIDDCWDLDDDFAAELVFFRWSKNTSLLTIHVVCNLVCIEYLLAYACIRIRYNTNSLISFQPHQHPWVGLCR